MMKKEDIDGYVRSLKNVTTEPVRLLEWKENPGMQRFDKRVTDKVGCS